jgi:hypothetical protein
MRYRLRVSLNQTLATIPTHSGVVATRAAEDATLVYCNEVIQVAKWIAKQVPDISASHA